jgi:DNA-binding transcriptional LysR family regulator
MDQIDIEIFLAIVNKRNITKAAEALNYSQSTISTKLKQLEDELQTKLIYRRKGKRYIELTIQGEQFAVLAERWINLYRDTYELKQSASLSINIGMIDSLSSSVLVDVFMRLLNDEIPIRLKISTHQSGELFNLIENHTIDIGFVSIPLKRKNVDVIPILKQKYYLVRYSENPSSPRKVDPQTLDPKLEIFQSWGEDYDNWHNYIWNPNIRSNIWVDTISLLNCFLKESQYWSIVNENSLKELQMLNANIQVDELADPPPERICYMIKYKYPKSGSVKGIEIFEKYLNKYIYI